MIVVGPDHPCWKSIDDDDWNGATFTNWVLNAVVGQHIRLRPPADLPVGTVQRVWQAVASSAAFVELEGVTVHILKHGRSGCGMQGLPGEWPEGHRWVGFRDPDVRAAATCLGCRASEGLGLPCKSAASQPRPATR